MTGPSSAGAVQAGQQGQLVMPGNYFAYTGFTRIELDAFNNITIDAAVAPSLVKLKPPVPAAINGANASLNVPTAGSGPVPGHADLIMLDNETAYETGPTSVNANAGQVYPWQSTSTILPNNNATLTISPGAVISTAPGGTIALSAPGLMNMAGILESPGGVISLKSTLSNVVIKENGEIIARGYNSPDLTSSIAGLGCNYTPGNGGQVTLQASNGDLTLDQGSLIDISGSDIVENSVLSGGKVISYSEAGNPGSLSLIYTGRLTWDGSVNAQAKMAGLQGGALAITDTNTSTNYGMTITAGEIAGYLTAGFDAMTFKSNSYLQFSGPINANIGRQLTLDAPEIIGSGSDVVNLTSPWITLQNTYKPAVGTATSGSAQFTLSSNGWIDLIGSIIMSGFQEVYLDAARDMQLTDQLYTTINPNIVQGQLSTAGDLVLQADRIYPTTLSDFTLQSGGKMTVLPAANPVGGPIYSAGGNLTVTAVEGLDVSGTLAAPMGTINLTAGTPTAPGRIYLEAGSVVTTAGNAMVNYGSIDVNNNWILQPQTSSGSPTSVDSNNLPANSVTLSANETIIGSGAVVDASGGGSIFAYNFQSGIAGTVDPLTKAGTYIVMSGPSSVIMPGTQVYLTGGGGLSAGTYSLLPVSSQYGQYAQYAFEPGAYVLQVQSGSTIPSPNSVTNNGYPLVVGYTGVAGTSILGTKPIVYSVMPAAAVLTEGSYGEQTLTAGNAGNIAINGTTTIIDGELKAAAAAGYQGGLVALSGQDIIVQSSSTSPLGTGFNFNAPIPAALQGELTVSGNSLSGNGSNEIDLGDAVNTDTITVQSGAVLAVPVISLTAKNLITVQSGAQLLALVPQGQTGIGEITLTSPNAVIGAGTQGNPTLHASHAVNLNVGNLENQGDNTVQVDHSALVLTGEEISFVPAGYTSTGQGLYITQSLWNQYSAIGDITLKSSSDIQFDDNFQLSAGGSLTLDAAQILGLKAGGSIVTLTAPAVNLMNSGSFSTTSSKASGNAGSFSVNATGQIIVGSGDILFGGFSAINLNGNQGVTLKGQGSLATGNANLVITTPLITTASDYNAAGTYLVPNFLVVAGINKNDTNPAYSITMTVPQGVQPGLSGSAGSSILAGSTGGTVAFAGSTIDLYTVLAADAGTINLTATGANLNGIGIDLHNGGEILAAGTGAAPGGNVTLSTVSGSLVMEQGSLINVSGGTQGDAGVVTLQAPVGRVSIAGNLSGTAQGGLGGSLVLYTNQLSDADMTGLIGTLATGGFTESVNIRTQTGDLDIASGTPLQAYNVTLTAGGGINVYGTIDASAYAGQSTGGTVGLYANNDINIQSGGKIAAKGVKGGYVLLNSEQGLVNVDSGGTIDVSSVSGGTGGTAYLRAPQNGSDVNINLNGAITGAEAVYVEAFRTYNVSSDYTSASSDYTTWLSDTANYYSTNTAANRLLGNAPALAGTFHFLPGIEVASPGYINWNAVWDSSSTRFGGEPGVLTLRAEGDLNVNRNVVDHPTVMDNLTGAPVMDSWALNLVAGADLSSANYMSVNRNGAGDLTIANNTVVYTEGAPIRFASGSDTLIGSGVNTGYMINGSMSYNLASYDGPIQGNVGRDLVITGGAIQTAIGNIDITTGRDLILNTSSAILGAIRTTGVGPDLAQYWNYAGGGSITLVVGRSAGSIIEGQLETAQNQNEWDLYYYENPSGTRFNSAAGLWGADYERINGPLCLGGPTVNVDVTAGLATMGGGDLTVRTAGDFLMQAGTFGTGNLAVYANGNISGRFLNNNGRGEIHAMGNFGTTQEYPLIELFNSQMAVTAGGDIFVGAVVNPTFSVSPTIQPTRYFWDLSYTQDTSISLKAGGNLTFLGSAASYAEYDPTRMTIMPATVDMEAGGDIQLLNSMTLTPSATGNLTIIAGGSINGYNKNSTSIDKFAAVMMSDEAPVYVYTVINDPLTLPYGNTYLADMENFQTHGFYRKGSNLSAPLHTGDNTPVVIQAGQDIESLALLLPKKAEITAGLDIIDAWYSGQNLSVSDLSEIKAGRDISLIYTNEQAVQAIGSGFQQAGPGALIVEAGGSISLGTTNGIQTTGNSLYPALGSQGSSLVVIAGYSQDMTADAVREFFDQVQTAGADYSTLLAAGKTGEAVTLLQNIRTGTIYPFLGTATGTGDIDMNYSKIESESGKSDIFIIANGSVNVGLTTFFNTSSAVQQSDTGILTDEGGAINVYSRLNVNVNESRLMTFFGGNITLWSDQGNVNAGIGSKTVINAQPPKTELNPNGDGDYILVFSPPSAGSGIRAVTYDPYGAAGPPGPPPGDIYLFAPQGIIDAGEAGISGGKVVLAATEVLNVNNINFSNGSVGVPVATTATVGLGALSGQGSVATQNSQMLSDASGINAANAAQASQMIDNIMAKWLDVKVVDFVEE